MRRRFVSLALSLVAVVVVLPSAPAASAQDAASVNEVSMLVDAHLNGKDAWSPGGRELHWTGAKCPLRVQFKGEVLVDRVTKITYRWERSDGEALPTQSFDVTKPDALVEVAPPDSWTIGAPGKTFRGAEIFHVLTPNEMTISTPIRVECQ